MSTSAQVEWVHLDEAERWDRAVQAIPGWDVYWLSGYARVWEAGGDGRPVLAVLERGSARAATVFLVRPIPGEPDLWDIATPYGYGGPLFTPGSPDLACALMDQVARHAAAHGGVSEFIRFHPLLGNHAGLALPDLSIAQVSETVYIDLQQEPHFSSGFRPEVRNRVRRATRAGVTVRLTPGPESVDAFLPLYTETMARVGALPYYLFPPETFRVLCTGLRRHLLLAEACHAGRTVAAALFLYNDRYLHYHLGGSATEALHLAPNNLLFAEVAEWGRQRGIRFMHLGGGLRPGDSLMRFKSGFSPLRAPFCVGRRIIDPDQYARLAAAHAAQIRPAQPARDFFPAYRAPAAPVADEPPAVPAVPGSAAGPDAAQTAGVPAAPESAAGPDSAQSAADPDSAESAAGPAFPESAAGPASAGSAAAR